jgi:hypothetical protein
MRKGIWQYGKLKYAQKVTPPAMSSGEIENERLENERLENERLKEWIHKIENTLQLR